MKNLEALNPGIWPRPSGYSHAVVSDGPFVFISGQLGCDYVSGKFGQDFVTQVTYALENIVTILEETGSKPDQIVKMTWYVTNKTEYEDCAPEIGRIYRRVLGNYYPAMTLVEVSSLLPTNAKVEIEAIAVV